ncbi:hypothetical protein [Actinomarinicola tropica]|uniref:Uncharacterized protein n=1 Tax=Actinomarinicola tropica TaxID=2789776 RepID=A0A5Q2RTN4_9ACTN|nr:hypothetical protein [Actinomarinicola tropica]QGG96575.1 hypothetical protein GH723_16520 [Actinomarinicola tropica]
MHQHLQLLADAALRERQLQRHRPDHHHQHHLHRLRADHPVRRHLARALVRLARVVEPGVAGAPAGAAAAAPSTTGSAPLARAA